MNVGFSSAEFDLNGDFYATMFGVPHKKIKNGICEIHPEAMDYWKKISMPLAEEDIGKLNAWEEYKTTISGLYQSNSTQIMVDVNNHYWVSINGTGWGCAWTVGLGSLESGKYPVR
jgi:hypothetical protein